MIAAVVILVVVAIASVVVKAAVVVEVVLLTAAVKSLVWAGEVIDTLGEVLVIDVRVDVAINVLGAVTIAFGFPLAVPILYSVDVLTSFGVNVLLDVNENAFVVVMTVTFAMPAPSEGFSSCWAAIDCQLMTALECARVLQARIASYHV